MWLRPLLRLCCPSLALSHRLIDTALETRLLVFLEKVDIVGVFRKWTTEIAPGLGSSVLVSSSYAQASTCDILWLCSHTGPVAHSVRLSWRMLSMVAEIAVSMWSMAFLVHIGRVKDSLSVGCKSVVWFVGWGNKGSMVDWGQAGSMVGGHSEGLGRAATPGAPRGEQVRENVGYLQASWSTGLGKWAGQG